MISEVSNRVRPMPKPQAVLFDAYGTLFDVYSVGLRAEQLFPGRGARLAVLWRDRQIDYSRLVTMSGDPARYRSFWDITERALRYAIQAIVPQAVHDWASYADAAASLAEAAQTRPLPGTQGHDQANKQRKAAALEQEKATQGNWQQDKCSDDSLFKH